VTTIISAIDQVNKWAGKLAAILLLPLTIITMYEVFMRYVVGMPTIWSWDLNIQLFAAIIMLGGGEALRTNAHVGMDVFVHNLSPKKRAVLDLATYSILFFGVVVLLHGGWELAWSSWLSKEVMPTIWAPPYYPIKMMIPLGAALILLQGIAEVCRRLQVLRGSAGGE